MIGSLAAPRWVVAQTAIVCLEKSNAQWRLSALPFLSGTPTAGRTWPAAGDKSAFIDREVTITQSPGKSANTQPGSDAGEAHLADRSTRRRSFLADTVALLIFFTTTGAINERYIAGMSWEEVCNARLLGAVLMVPVARPYGLWRDRVMKRAGDTTMSQLFWDSLSLMTFQVPIYAGIIAISGAEGGGLLSGILGAAIMMLVLGRPYGAFLDAVRRLFGLPKGGSKPMSLNTKIRPR